MEGGHSYRWLRHLNKLRWLTLVCVFLLLVLIPFLHLYQTYVASHSYDLLSVTEKAVYDVAEIVTQPFVTDPEHDLDQLKGTTWSGTLFGIKLSDPLALAGQWSTDFSFYWPFVLTALIPIVLSVLLGRFFCGCFLPL